MGADRLCSSIPFVSPPCWLSAAGGSRFLKSERAPGPRPGEPKLSADLLGSATCYMLHDLEPKETEGLVNQDCITSANTKGNEGPC